MISICLTARPSWARVKTVCEALRGNAVFEVVCAGGALLRNYGRVVDQVRADGYEVVELPTVFEGETLETGVLSTAAACEAYGRYFAWSQPRLAVVIADRREVLGAAIAASYQNIPLLHLLAGERSGSIDDKVRDAITSLSDYYAVANYEAAERVTTLCEAADVCDILNRDMRITGCPSTDLALCGVKGSPVEMNELGGVGPTFRLDRKDFAVVMIHPDTNDIDGSVTLAEAALYTQQPAIVFWPGEDPGQDRIAKVYREMRERFPDAPWHFVRNQPPERFYKLLSQAHTLYGNSSVGVREARSITGLRIVNVGNRQQGRYEGDYGSDGKCGQRVAQWIQAIVRDSSPRGQQADSQQKFHTVHR